MPPVDLNGLFPLRHPLAGVTEAEVGQAIASFLQLSGEWPHPEQLGDELPPVPTFDTDLMPSSLRPMVEDIADRMQVPLDLPAVSAVAALSGVCGRRAVILPKEHDPWTVVPNLWGAIVAGPGMMKSPVIHETTAPAKALEAEWRNEHTEALQEFEEEQERAKLDDAVWAESYKKAKKKGDPIPERPRSELGAPTQRRLVVADATFESLHQLLADNPAGLFALRDELTGWLASLERQGRESERAFYLECWNGDSGFTIDRIGRGSIHVEAEQRGGTDELDLQREDDGGQTMPSRCSQGGALQSTR